MKTFIVLLASALLGACSTGPNVQYSKVATQALPPSSTVELIVDVPEGETEKQWRTTRKKTRARLDMELKGERVFQHVGKEGEAADYQLEIDISDVETGYVGLPPGAQDDPLTRFVVGSANAQREPDEIRRTGAYVTLLDAGSGQKVMAFKASAKGDYTDETIGRLVSRIMAGLQCYGEECIAS